MPSSPSSVVHPITFLLVFLHIPLTMCPDFTLGFVCCVICLLFSILCAVTKKKKKKRALSYREFTLSVGQVHVSSLCFFWCSPSFHSVRPNWSSVLGVGQGYPFLSFEVSFLTRHPRLLHGAITFPSLLTQQVPLPLTCTQRLSLYQGSFIRVGHFILQSSCVHTNQFDKMKGCLEAKPHVLLSRSPCVTMGISREHLVIRL